MSNAITIPYKEFVEMKNKYYTPEIEEFHVGFEYEKYQGEWFCKISDLYDLQDVKTLINKQSLYEELVKYKNELEFTKHSGMILPSGLTYKSIMKNKHCYTKQVRAKYLDQEDIESFGFKLEGGKLIKYIKDIYKAKTKVGSWELTYSFGSEKFWEERGPQLLITQGEVQLFYGQCKNKSELKRILIQVGYEQTE